MLDSAFRINEFQTSLEAKILADLPETALYEPGAGHGHPPIWIMGHLAICAELGQKLLGGQLTHRRWLLQFGPGSSDRIDPDASYSNALFADAIAAGYAEFRQLAKTAPEEILARPHSISLFEGTPIKTVGDFVTLLLTNHFGFHLAQLSSCRREAGHKPLF